MPEQTVPLIVDSVKPFGDFPFLRCIYYYVEFEEGVPVQMSYVRGLPVPALLLEGKAVIVGPGRGEEFESPEAIRRIFQSVSKPGTSVENGVAWIPGYFLEAGGNGKKVGKGQVVRVPPGAFALGLAYGRGGMDEDEFMELWRPYAEQTRLSPRDTEAFGAWTETAIDRLRRMHHAAPENFIGRKHGGE
jgi:hypothetical protein